MFCTRALKFDFQMSAVCVGDPHTAFPLFSGGAAS